MILFLSSTAAQSPCPPPKATQVPPHSCMMGSMAVVTPPDGTTKRSSPSIISWMYGSRLETTTRRYSPISRRTSRRKVSLFQLGIVAILFFGYAPANGLVLCRFKLI